MRQGNGVAIAAIITNILPGRSGCYEIVMGDKAVAHSEGGVTDKAITGRTFWTTLSFGQFECLEYVTVSCLEVVE